MSRPVDLSQVKTLFERWSRIETERREMSDTLKDFFAECKSRGFNTKALRAAFNETYRASNETADQRSKRETNDADTDLYLSELASHARERAAA